MYDSEEELPCTEKTDDSIKVIVYLSKRSTLFTHSLLSSSYDYCFRKPGVADVRLT